MDVNRKISVLFMVGIIQSIYCWKAVLMVCLVELVEFIEIIILPASSGRLGRTYIVDKSRHPV